MESPHPWASSLPIAVLGYRIHNRSDAPLPITVCFSLPNFIGADGSCPTLQPATAAPCACGAEGNVNESFADQGLVGVLMRSDGVDPKDPAWGTMALSALWDESQCSRRLSWQQGGWGRPLLDFWQDLCEDGRLDPRTGKADQPAASLALHAELAPGEEQLFQFILTWHFPNRPCWLGKEVMTNHYTTVFPDAKDVALRCAPQLGALEERSLSFTKALFDGDQPRIFTEAALANCSTLRTQTCFCDEAGRLYGWEGCDDNRGCCPGSCTHVWNYDLATPQLFPDLARSMREVEFLHCCDDQGRMNFRVQLPLERNAAISPEKRLAAADGQMGCIIKAYREWRLAGDNAWLNSIYPQVRRALEFCWIPGGWDADCDGIMEGCQHNTMDVEYLGPNPQMGVLYLAALRAAAIMARACDDENFAKKSLELAEKG